MDEDIDGKYGNLLSGLRVSESINSAAGTSSGLGDEADR